MNVADFGPTRRSIYVLLITVAAAALAGRILSVQRLSDPGVAKPSTITPPDGDPPDPEDLNPSDPRGAWRKDRPRPMPTHGDNDRSRWATIRALVDDHTYVIGKQEQAPPQWPVEATSSVGLIASPLVPSPLLAAANLAPRLRDTGIVAKDGWVSIDRVQDPKTHDYYSSKPPLLPTILAGEYWVLRAFGLSIVTDRWIVMRTILFTINWLPWVFYLWLLAKLCERFGTTDWGRLFVLTAACFGTLVTPFLNTLNNHTLAAFTALFALYPVLISARAPMTATQLLMAGFFAGFTACNELPAAIFAVALFAWCLFRSPGRTLLYFAPAAAIPVAAFLATNWIAFHQFSPAYDKFGTEWYEYPGSHWNPEPDKMMGIDWASRKEGAGVYAFHVILGHHGLLSLTPVFLLGLAGMLVGLGKLKRGKRDLSITEISLPAMRPSIADARALAVLGVLALAISVIVVAYYVFPVNLHLELNSRNRNYGGWSVGARWLIWLTPLFLLSMQPVCDWLAGRRWGRGLACALLAVSVLSASYPTWNPWRHPWLYNLVDALGGIPY